MGVDGKGNCSNKELMTVAEVADFFKISPKTIYAWLMKGKIQGGKIAGSLIRIQREEIEQLVVSAFSSKKENCNK